MQVTSEQPDPCTVVLDIEVDEQQVARAFDSSYREFGRHTSVPGFRAGKAPRGIVERYVDSERVRRHALEKIVRDSYVKAVREADITPYRDPEFQFGDLEDKKPYSYKATVPLEPHVTIGPYTGIVIEKPVYTVTDEMVEQRIERLREERARLDRVTDRGVQPDDVLIVENQVNVEGEDEEATPARRQLVQLGNNVPGYDDAVMGMLPAEERTFELTYPNDFDEESRRGKRATYTVKLSSISAKRLPELNDEFATQAAGVATLEDMRKVVRMRMEADAARMSDEIAEQRLLDKIVKGSEIHFPNALVQEEVQDKLRQLSEEIAQNRLTYSQYLAQMGRSAEQHQAQLASLSHAQIQVLLALREIAGKENLQTSNESVEAEFDRLLNEGVIDDTQYEEYRRDQRRRLQVANALVQQTLHDFLFANNTINEVAAPDGPDEEAIKAIAESSDDPVAGAAADPGTAGY